MSTEQSTNSGKIEDLRDQIFLLIRLSLFFFILNRKASTKLPFHKDRGMVVKPSVISTAQLNPLPDLHLPPIKRVVFPRPYSLRMGDLILRRRGLCVRHHCWLLSYAKKHRIRRPVVDAWLVHAWRNLDLSWWWGGMRASWVVRCWTVQHGIVRSQGGSSPAW
jgi:hypothetical protein